jgi:type I restriction enzyme S subunit
MPQNWKTYKLEEIISKLGDGLHGTPKYSENGEYAFINGNNLTNGNIIIKEDTKRVNYEQYLKYKKELNNRTLLVSINGTIGNVAYYNGEKVMLGKSACYFNLNENVDKDFVRHVISSNHFKNYLETNATGSVIKNVSLKSMREFPIKLPLLQEQRAIASILSALDDKIELNLQMNKTMEDMAMALYKHWFVDFGPSQSGEFVDSELGMIPKGWEVKRLPEISINHNKFRKPISTRERAKISGIYPYYGATKVLDYLSDFNFDGEYILLAEDGTVKTHDDKPYLQFVRGQFCVSNHAHVITGNEDYSNEFLFLSLSNKNVIPIITGAVQLKINKQNLESLEFIVPSKSILKLFEELIIPFYNKMDALETENQTLTTLRDTLLPKLISGEVRVKDIKQTIAEVL